MGAATQQRSSQPSWRIADTPDGPRTAHETATAKQRAPGSREEGRSRSQRDPVSGTQFSPPPRTAHLHGVNGRTRRGLPSVFMSNSCDAMSDVYAKLDWADQHVAELVELGRDFLRPGGGDERPLGIEFDDTRRPVVVAKFIVEKPLPVEISLHAGDLVHNARTALDHIIARLKDHFGGGRQERHVPDHRVRCGLEGPRLSRRAGKRVRGPLDALPCAARMLIYREQPHIAYTARRQEDPMAILSAMDNTDKHRLLHHGFAYPAAKRGLDLLRSVTDARLCQLRTGGRAASRSSTAP
jgi:hypothetical protein